MPVTITNNGTRVRDGVTYRKITVTFPIIEVEFFNVEGANTPSLEDATAWGNRVVEFLRRDALEKSVKYQNLFQPEAADCKLIP